MPSHWKTEICDSVTYIFPKFFNFSTNTLESKWEKLCSLTFSNPQIKKQPPINLCEKRSEVLHRNESILALQITTDWKGFIIFYKQNKTLTWCSSWLPSPPHLCFRADLSHPLYIRDIHILPCPSHFCSIRTRAANTTPELWRELVRNIFIKSIRYFPAYVLTFL